MKKFKAHSDKILQMMIHSVYTNKDVFLRELISNASDACDKARFLSLTMQAYQADYKISIIINKNDKILTIKDNGIGMDEDELETNLGVIAQSDTADFKKAGSSKDEQLIGQFGVGFYSGFMVAKKIEFISKKPMDKAYIFSSDSSGYTIEKYEQEFERGSEVRLYLKDNDEDESYDTYLNKTVLENLIKQYSDYIHYPIYILDSLDSNSEQQTPVNSMTPIWKKKDASDKELNDFFMSKYHFSQPYIKHLNYSVEGSVSYKALLFIPQEVPFDYFSIEYDRGVSLYNSGVMIMENCKELLPDYLAFVKGVVESEDISLNISRELMQKDKKIAVIAKNIEKKVLSELEKMKKDQIELYERFFNAFGSSIKLGIYTSFGMRANELKDLLLYYSSKQQQLISLSQYVSNLDPEQKKEILYACGDDILSLQNSPAVEYATSNNREVLFLTDKIDEFVIKILNNYNDIPFVSVSDFSLSTDTTKINELTEQNKQLLADIQSLLQNKVSEVRLSEKLGNTLVALSSSNDISLQMEKVLNAVNKDNKATSQKVLQINPHHPLFKNIKQSKNLSDYATLLYFEACLQSNLEIPNPQDSIKALNNLLQTPNQNT